MTGTTTPRDAAGALLRPEIVVDLDAIAHNVRLLGAHTGRPVMAVVKADGYGHGMLPVARAARAAGAAWLGVATTDEARALRAAGDTGPLLCWLLTPGEDLSDLVRDGVDVTAGTRASLTALTAAAQRAGRAARVQLKIDTGLRRNGALPQDWPALVAATAAAVAAGTVELTGVWSHLACADEPAHPANAAQRAAFADALAVVAEHGLDPGLRHLANSAASVLDPASHHDLVRCGIAVYGLDPAPEVPHGLPLRPALTLRAPLVLVKPRAAGESVSYGHTWTAPAGTTVGLVPVGYGEGVPRAASGVVEVQVAGRRRALRGRVCMDQVVVDLGGDAPPVGAEVVLFGPPAPDGSRPTVQEWAQACGTINYEIVTRLGGRLTRRYVGHDPGRSAQEGTA
ncbi:alanine racemase [Nocardioides sp.]|uniref:alanine racemase n=1 Tax=Nocardioides sp. TaxID=35761 RepID=UPI0035173780